MKRLVENEGSLTWTVPEFAASVKISTARAYALAQAGQIPCVHFGRSVRIPKEAIQKFLSDAMDKMQAG